VVKAFLTLVFVMMWGSVGIRGRGVGCGVFAEILHEHRVVCRNAEIRDFGRFIDVGHGGEVRRWLDGGVRGGKGVVARMLEHVLTHVRRKRGG
jgi:hypothetical protein